MKTSTALLITALLAMAPAAGAQTAGQDYTNGINDLAVTNLDAANINFSNAVSLAPTNATYNVFYAMTELLTLPDQPAGSNFLTRIGIASAGRDIYNWKAQGQTNANGHLIIPSTTPPLNADEFTAQLRTNVLSVISAVGSNLARVTDTNFTLDLTTNETHMGAVTLDWGDVQMLQAMCDTAELFIYTTHSYNLDVQLATASNYFGKDGSFEAF